MDTENPTLFALLFKTSIGAPPKCSRSFLYVTPPPVPEARSNSFLYVNPPPSNIDFSLTSASFSCVSSKNS